MNWFQLLESALDIGEQMEVAGAEVYRVEDCIKRICQAYGATDVDVFTITSSIVLTIQQPDGKRLTQTRRITIGDTDLERLDQLNRLSRYMCLYRPDFDEVTEKFQAIMVKKRYPLWAEYTAYALVAGAFTVFAGGAWSDGLASALIGMVLKAVVQLGGILRLNRVLSSLISSFAVSMLAFFAVHFILGQEPDQIIIGNIMLLIPGIGLTNSLRDMISGDTMSGLLRFLESCIIALAIAAGYILASGLWEVLL